MVKRIQYQPPGNSRTVSPPPQLGTVLYRGAVPPTTGEWLGIEWDEPSRGKHSGVHEKSGVRYFETRVKGAGSFLRPDAPGLALGGLSFREAFEARYGRSTSTSELGDDSAESGRVTSQFYKTPGNFDVEVVLSDQVPAKFRQLSRLREAGLDWTSLSRAYEAGQGDGPGNLGKFGATLSGLEVLDLSCTMLPSLDEAARITLSLPKLSILSLNSNRFDAVRDSPSLTGFARLTSIKLNNTLLTWPEIVRIGPSLPNVASLEFGSNRLTSLLGDSTTPLVVADDQLFPRLATLNLETNELANWEDTVQALSDLPSLETLVLDSNRFTTLALPNTRPAPFTLRRLRHLTLRRNLLASWSTSIDALGDSIHPTFPSLRILDIANNPFADVCTAGAPAVDFGSAVRDRTLLHARLSIIARLPWIDTLEGTPVSAAERDDAEKFWIVNALVDGAEELSPWARRRLETLKRAHESVGTTSDLNPTVPAALKSRLIRLRVVTSNPSPTETSASDPISAVELSILPSVRTLLLRAQLSRLLGKALPRAKYSLVGWLRSKDVASEAVDEGQATGGEKWLRVEISAKEEGREVGWWGFQDGDRIAVESV
ncbi:hypothetical protein JCM11491_001322 [Sporobolomyces phaffii]